jgi:DNA-directed RNA polymerase specialized sigma24 family protein
MASEGSITLCIQLLKAGERAAAQHLWERYFHRLVGLARARLRGTARRTADEEDVALSAFDSFYQRAEHGQFPRLNDRDDLWQLLVVITVRKAVDQVHHEGRQIRGSGRVLLLSELTEQSPEGILAKEPTPEFAAQITDECRRLYDRLGDGTLRAVAMWKLEGDTNAEIAAKLGCVVQTVERKLRAIRQLWAKEIPG